MQKPLLPIYKFFAGFVSETRRTVVISRDHNWVQVYDEKNAPDVFLDGQRARMFIEEYDKAEALRNPQSTN